MEAFVPRVDGVSNISVAEKCLFFTIGVFLFVIAIYRNSLLSLTLWHGG